MTTMTVTPLAEPLRKRIPVLPTKPIASRLDVRLDIQHDALVAHLVGDLDGESAESVERRIADLAARGQVKLVLELHQLFSADVAGLAVLRDAAALLSAQGGWLALAALRPRMRHFLARTGTADQFATYKSVEEAVRGESAKADGVVLDSQALEAESGVAGAGAGAGVGIADQPKTVVAAAQAVIPALVTAIKRR